MSRATSSLRPSRPAPLTEHTVSELRRLHPAPLCAVSEWLDTEVFTRALATAPRLAAPGPSGWIYDHLISLCVDGPGQAICFRLLLATCSLLVTGRVPTTVAPLLATCSLIAMSKKDDPDPYHDDTHVLGPPASVAGAAAALQRLFAWRALRIQPLKCAAFGWSANEQIVTEQFSSDVRVCDNGIVVLGVPIGPPESLSASITASVNETLAIAESLLELDAQAALLLLRVLATDDTSIGRVGDPVPNSGAGLALVALRLAGASHAVGPGAQGDWGSFSDAPSAADHVYRSTALAQIFLPITTGGHGIRSAKSEAMSAFVGGWAAAAAPIRERFRHQRPRFFRSPRGHRRRRQSFSGDSQGRRTSPTRQRLPTDAQHHGSGPYGVQGVTARSDSGDDHAIERFDAAARPCDVTRRRGAAATGAGAWMIAIPLWPALRIPPNICRTAVRTLLGLPQPLLTGIPACPCGHVRSDIPQLATTHVMRCPRGTGVTATHDAVKYEVGAIMREAGFRVAYEVSGILSLREGETQGRRVDLLVTEPGADGRILLDVVVKASTVESGATARQAEATKRGKFSDAHRTDTFIPLALETHGALREALYGLLRRCAACVVRERDQDRARIPGYLRTYRHRLRATEGASGGGPRQGGNHDGLDTKGGHGLSDHDVRDFIVA
eukprot:jgi/Chlat1/826/Chrsp104S01286